MSDYAIKLYAGQYSHLSMISRVLNLDYLVGKDIWIMLPEDLASYPISEISRMNDQKAIDNEHIFREGRAVRLSADVVSLDRGIHQYEVTLVHPITNDIVHCYFQYLIQDDNPDTPYIYMNRKETNDVTSDILKQDVSVEQETK